MTDPSHDRRQCDKKEREDLSVCYKGIEKQLTEINGKVQKHDGWLGKLFKRVKALEVTDIHEDGVQEGKQLTAGKIKSVVMTTCMILACLFGLLKVLQFNQKSLIQRLAIGQNTASDSKKIKAIETSLELIKNLLVKEDDDG